MCSLLCPAEFYIMRMPDGSSKLECAVCPHSPLITDRISFAERHQSSKVHIKARATRDRKSAQSRHEDAHFVRTEAEAQAQRDDEAAPQRDPASPSTTSDTSHTSHIRDDTNYITRGDLTFVTREFISHKRKIDALEEELR